MEAARAAHHAEELLVLGADVVELTVGRDRCDALLELSEVKREGGVKEGWG